MIRSTMFSMQKGWEANALRFKILWNEIYCWVMIATSILKRKKGTIQERQVNIDRLYCSWKDREKNNLSAFGNFIGRSRMIRSTMFSMQIEWEANALRFKILWNERYFWVMIATSISIRKKGKINERQIYIDRLDCSCCRSMRQHDAHLDTPFQD